MSACNRKNDLLEDRMAPGLFMIQIIIGEKVYDSIQNNA